MPGFEFCELCHWPAPTCRCRTEPYRPWLAVVRNIRPAFPECEAELYVNARSSFEAMREVKSLLKRNNLECDGFCIPMPQNGEP